LIGIGAKARGMGGIGIGMSHGAESALANPAMITSVKGTEVSFGGTIFMPDVKNRYGMGMSH
jgi:long-chain fatty acid transport protein